MDTAPLILDAWAAMAYFSHEKAAILIAKELGEAVDRGRPMLISAVNAGEVFYGLGRRLSEAEAETGLRVLAGLGVDTRAADEDQARSAAGFKLRRGLGYADSFAAALTLSSSGVLLTGDPDFHRVEKEIKIHWVKP